MTDIVERMKYIAAANELIHLMDWQSIRAAGADAAAEIERLRAALGMALEYEPVRQDFQYSTKGDQQFAESKKVFSEIRAVLPSPPFMMLTRATLRQ